MTTRKLVWVTRSAPGAEETAGRLRALGIEPLVAPLLELRDLPKAEIDLDGIGAIAFTSANAVRAFVRRCGERGLKVFAVGAATAAAARAAGFDAVLASQGSVVDLAAAIAAGQRQLCGAILHPGAAEPAGDLKGALARHGVETRSVALYESAPAAMPGKVLALIPRLHAVLVHSPRAARALATILEAAPAPMLAAHCLSPAVAAPLVGLALAELTAASSPTEEALLKLIRR